MSLEQKLRDVEQALEKISAALLAADPLELERSSAQLRTALDALVLGVQRQPGQAWPQALLPRVQAVSNQLAMQREQLARLGALVDKQVASLLPPAAHAGTTYGKNNGPGAARIYRSST